MINKLHLNRFNALRSEFLSRIDFANENFENVRNKCRSIVSESRIFRVMWSFTEFIKSDDSASSMRCFIISVISSVIDDAFSILSSLRDDLLFDWSFLFLIRHICFQWPVLWHSEHSELIVEHLFFEWLARPHLVHFLFSFESFFLFSFFLSLRLLSFWLFFLISSLLILVGMMWVGVGFRFKNPHQAGLSFSGSGGFGVSFTVSFW
jgi:hypothetical protein